MTQEQMLTELLLHNQMGFFDAMNKLPKKNISNVYYKSAYDSGWISGGGLPDYLLDKKEEKEDGA